MLGDFAQGPQIVTYPKPWISESTKFVDVGRTPFTRGLLVDILVAGGIFGDRHRILHPFMDPIKPLLLVDKILGAIAKTYIVSTNLTHKVSKGRIKTMNSSGTLFPIPPLYWGFIRTLLLFKVKKWTMVA